MRCLFLFQSRPVWTKRLFSSPPYECAFRYSTSRANELEKKKILFLFFLLTRTDDILLLRLVYFGWEWRRSDVKTLTKTSRHTSGRRRHQCQWHLGLLLCGILERLIHRLFGCFVACNERGESAETHSIRRYERGKSEGAIDLWKSVVKGEKKNCRSIPTSWAPRNGGIDDISILHVSRLSSVPLFQPSSFSFWIATLKWWGESDCRGFATSRFLSGRWQRTRHRQNGWGLRENRETSKLWLPPPARYWFINLKKKEEEE